MKVIFYEVKVVRISTDSQGQDGLIRRGIGSIATAAAAAAKIKKKYKTMITVDGGYRGYREKNIKCKSGKKDTTYVRTLCKI